MADAGAVADRDQIFHGDRAVLVGADAVVAAADRGDVFKGDVL